MTAMTEFRKRFVRAFRKAFMADPQQLPAWLETGPDAKWIDWRTARVDELNQAREQERRNALKALNEAVDAMIRANLAHVIYQTRLKQPPYEGLPFPLEEAG